MIPEDVEKMKYQDLRKYVKSLGLANNGKKEQLIQIVKEYFDNKNNTSDKLTATSNLNTINNVNDDEDQLKTPDNEVIKQKTKKTRKAAAKSAKKVEEVLIDDDKSKRVQSVSPVKRRGKNKVKKAETIDEPFVKVKVVEEEKEEDKSEKKASKRKKKKKSHENTPVVAAAASPLKESIPTSIVNSVKETPSLTVNNQQETIESSLLTNDESSLLIKQQQQDKDKENIVIDSQTLSITNDDESTNEPSQESIKPQLNTSSSKRQSKHKRASSVPSKFDTTYEKELEEDKKIQHTDNVTTTAIADSVVAPKIGGARIVKPTINGQEITIREAGPRIVKPVIIENDNNKKNGKNDKAKVVKPIAKPDFKAIHKKMEEKMESIDDYNKRVRQRHEVLATTSSAKKKQIIQKTAACNENVMKSAKVNLQQRSSSVVKSQTLTTSKSNDAIKTTAATTTTSSVAAPSSTSNFTSNIPKLIKQPKPQIEEGLNTPTTPATRRAAITPQTRTIRKYVEQQQLAYNQQQQQTQHISRHLNTITNNLNGSMLQNNALSAFSRRKSFDIGASLARPLKYQPHTGRLKPIDPATKNKIQQQQQQLQSRRESINILNANKGSKSDMLHDHIKSHTSQITEKFKANELYIRKTQKQVIRMNNRDINVNQDE